MLFLSRGKLGTAEFMMWTLYLRGGFSLIRNGTWVPLTKVLFKQQYAFHGKEISCFDPNRFSLVKTAF